MITIVLKCVRVCLIGKTMQPWSIGNLIFFLYLSFFSVFTCIQKALKGRSKLTAPSATWMTAELAILCRLFLNQEQANKRRKWITPLNFFNLFVFILAETNTGGCLTKQQKKYDLFSCSLGGFLRSCKMEESALLGSVRTKTWIMHLNCLWLSARFLYPELLFLALPLHQGVKGRMNGGELNIQWLWK